MKLKVIFAVLVAVFAGYGASFASNAAPLEPAYIDRDAGYLYFLVQNNWDKPIKGLFGRVYGYGASGAPNVWYLVNNPHQEGMKISLEEHVPGATGMYRFKIPEDFAGFPRYSLKVENGSVYYTWVARWWK